jgi:hypothetical protein
MQKASFLGMAEAMPKDKYAVIPTAGKLDGVRSFAEQVKHVDCAIRLLQRIRRLEAAYDCENGGHDSPVLSRATEVPQ